MIDAANDTLRPDTLLLQELRSNADYDYSRELLRGYDSLWTRFWKAVGDWFADFMSGFTAPGDYTSWLVVIAVAVVAGLVAFIIVKHPSIFFRRKVVESVEEDERHIYAIDYARSIAEAHAQGDWRRVVRLIYLETLKELSDGGRIAWQPSKTPTQYTREERDARFKTMTAHFLRIRYGGFDADEALASEMAALQRALMDGGQGSATEEKGGSDEA